MGFKLADSDRLLPPIRLGSQGRNHEHVERSDFRHAVPKKFPKSGRELGAPGHVPADYGLANVDTELDSSL
jgi:hypothetical protein